MNIPQNKEEVDGFLTAVGLNSVFKKQILDNFNIDFYKERIILYTKERVIACAGMEYLRLIQELEYSHLLTCFIICNMCNWYYTPQHQDSLNYFRYLVRTIIEKKVTLEGLTIFTANR